MHTDTPENIGADRGCCIRVHLRAVVLTTCCLATSFGCGDRTVPGDNGIVVVVIDTLRADHLGAYGYARPTSPNLDRLAAEGERYHHAFSQAPWTLPAVASILTGQLPQVHGAGIGADGDLQPVRPDIRTGAEHLRAAGYRTGAVVNVEFLEPGSGLARGFEHYDFYASRVSNRGNRDARQTTDAALSWAGGIGSEPFFLLVHYFDPHLTYDPPPPYDTLFQPSGTSLIPEGFGTESELFALRRGDIELDAPQRASLVARYDGEIRYVDEEFGRLRRGLEALGRWDRSLVIVVGDHGEEFWEHGGFEHAHSHHREVLQVPLIVRRPEGSAAVREGRARQIDILPTMLEYAGLDVASDLPGRALGEVGMPYSVAAGSLWSGHILSIRSDMGTLILSPSGVGRFFAPDDQAETVDVRDRNQQTADRLEDILRTLPQPTRAPAPGWELTEQQLQNLRTLGYIR